MDNATVTITLLAEKQDYKSLLRDWFAGQALAGMCALEDGRYCPSNRMNEVEVWRAENRKEDAENCYRYADAMLAAREKEAK